MGLFLWHTGRIVFAWIKDVKIMSIRTALGFVFRFPDVVGLTLHVGNWKMEKRNYGLAGNRTPDHPHAKGVLYH